MAPAPSATRAVDHRSVAISSQHDDGHALYVALAAELGEALLTDDHPLVNSPGFPANVRALTLDRS